MDTVYHSLVFEYLIHNCYKNTARALLKEKNELENFHVRTSYVNKIQFMAKTEIDDDHTWTLLDARKSIIAAIETGDINLAFALIKKSFPTIAVHNLIPNGVPPPNDNEAIKIHNILFQLKCQQFIEIIRTSTVQQALRYAQVNLRPTNATTTKLVEEVTTLIAYTDPYQSQVGHLLAQDRRSQLATEVNHILLAHCNLPIQTSIERLSRQMLLVEEELAKEDESSIDIREKMSI
ncbi:CTLH/CRA C-terminal to lish motif domain-containing protein [Mycotypha africana]|uniref:CTLH/CRA C-terminal to lish motif domain-containing protein n=1 Tax=Mycotypha africana TaxID=64632 RepID=UPI002300048A|nr:CTLH/CRA C-terminal to lish motif domain-containing protein [Mycotypha africana]KAI8988289.1 CTLH/CRA C-terminal to lish motif domain-containing protein [Mycotypha africana]